MIRNDVADYGKTFTPEEYAVTPERILGLDVREILISQVLKEADYATAVFGKWDGGQLRRYLPRQRGFDEFFGHTNTGIDYWTHERYGVPSMYRDNEPIKLEGYATELIKEEAVHFISEHKSEPFFLYVPFNAPHGASNFDKPGPQAPEEFTRRLYPNRDPRDSNRKRRRRTNYLACVTYMDACIGEMLDTLATHGLTDNTLVIFFSDNGGSSNADNRPLKGRKGQMFEGGLRVPFIARLPQRIPTGTLNHEFLTSLELFPTFTNLAGDKLPSGVVYDGFDMLPVLAGKKMSSRNEMFWKRRGDKAARVGNYKWVESAKGNGLFDLSNDPGEKRDLSAEHPDQLARLKNRFAKWEQDMNDAEPRGPFRDY
jgi:arylsulfatase A-like enzyme